MDAKSIKIEGVQKGFLVNFEVTQTFIHSEKVSKEVHYVFPNDLKICIYDTIFVVGEEIIKPILQSKNEAKNTYNEAIKSGRTAVFGSNINNGLTEFKLGNVQPGIECKVILKIAFTAQLTKEKEFFLKFPLDVYTPTGSVGCLQASEVSFQLSADKEKIKRIASNIKNGEFNEEDKKFTIKDKIESNDNENSIIITFETNEKIQCSALLTPSNLPNFDGCALLISPNLDATNQSHSEFVFVVDCSGSMSGNSIKKAGECLELFIKSLPTNSYFNVIQFGSRFHKLFENSELYNEQTAQTAINLAQKLSASLGGTNIYSPLKNIFQTENLHGQRQVFVMTDGEVFDSTKIMELVSKNSEKNRIFSIGIGRGCDAGLIEGIANASGGKCDFVQKGDSIGEKVIPQLRSSLHPSLNSIEIHIEGENNDSFEISPFPLPQINPNGASVVYLRMKKKEENSFEKGILITGNYGEKTVEIPFPIENIEYTQLFDEDKFGCSGGLNVGKAILPLFAFSILQKFERKSNISKEEEKKAIELSVSSGVLCKFTGFVGSTLLPTESYHGELFSYSTSHSCRSSAKSCCLGSATASSATSSGLPNSPTSSGLPNSPTSSGLPNSPTSSGLPNSPTSSGLPNSPTSSGLPNSPTSSGLLNSPTSSGLPNSPTSSGLPNSPTSSGLPNSPTSSGLLNSPTSSGLLISAKSSGLLNSPTSSGLLNSAKSSGWVNRATSNLKPFSLECLGSKQAVPKTAPRSLGFGASCKQSDSYFGSNDNKKENDNDLMEIIRCQNFSGFWENLEEVKRITGLKVDHIDEILVDDETIKNNCVATILAIAAIRVKSADKKNSWIMIVEKALNWLAKMLPKVDIEEVISRIEKLITK
ncbi:von Willebrand factor A domain-containing protein 5A [Tritrichomonas musculus]|uniref:von Willebrand factor A domain-containing protein 5A n=1 Tax=Tritrichomonas musculus TaxID=1915356 RepID=A0ABR2HVH3_9EUKA